jgi:hypothetical protein
MTAERLTDTTAGEYLVKVEEGHGMSFSGRNAGIHKTYQAVIYFQRAADGALERAWSGPSYFQDSDRNKRRTRAPANLTLGRLRSHLARTGKRWEVERDQERQAKRAANEAAKQAQLRMRAAAPVMLAALKAANEWAEYMGGFESPVWEQVKAAIKAAE